MRFKLVLADLLFRKGLLNTCDPRRITAHIIGFHNNDMLLLEDSLKIDGQAPALNHPDWQGVLEEAITKTRAYGKRVSDLQRHPDHPHIDSGSSFAPAKAITDVIQAICTGVPLTASFNVMIDEHTAEKYGVRPHQGLSIPVCLRRLDEPVEPDLSFRVNAKEQAALYQAQENIYQSVQTLFATAKEPIPYIDSHHTSDAERGVKGLSLLQF